jgi:hypothetical protein
MFGECFTIIAIKFNSQIWFCRMIKDFWMELPLLEVRIGTYLPIFYLEIF